MGTISIVIGLVSTLMPETLNENLPQTIEEGNEFGKNQKYFSWAKYALLFLSPKLLKTFYKNNFYSIYSEQNGHQFLYKVKTKSNKILL
jgi:hypothetical protein